MCTVVVVVENSFDYSSCLAVLARTNCMAFDIGCSSVALVDVAVVDSTFDRTMKLAVVVVVVEADNWLAVDSSDRSCTLPHCRCAAVASMSSSFGRRPFVAIAVHLIACQNRWPRRSILYRFVAVVN